MKNKVVLDATLLSSLMGCARLYDYRQNGQWQGKDGKSNSLEAGSIVHFILEHFNKSLIAGLPRTDAIDIGYAAGREYLTVYNEHNKYQLDIEHQGVKNTPEKSDKYKIGSEYCFQTMEQYFNHYKNDSFTTIAAEEVRGQVIYEDDDIVVLWKAKFDCIVDTNIGFLPKDYKTSKQRRDSATLNNQFIGQCLLVKSRSIIIDKIGFQTSLKPEEKFERVTISYSADRFAEWVNDIVPYYARMLVAYTEAGHFPPNYTHCENKYGFCDFYEHICQADRGMREETLKIFFTKGKKWDISND